MKEIDEFKIHRMLEEMPELNPSDRLYKNINSALAKSRNKKKSVINMKTWMSIAASVIMFVLGYQIAHKTNPTNEILQKQSIGRELLLQNLLEGSSDNTKLLSIQYLAESQPDEKSMVDELMQMIRKESNENVKLALIELISPYSDWEEVQDLLTELLINENNPLVTIPIINIISETKKKKGMEILKMYYNRKDIAPLVKNHMKYLEL